MTIELMPVGWDDRINDLRVYDSRKKRIIKRHGTVPAQVKLSDAASGEWIYVTARLLQSATQAFLA